MTTEVDRARANRERIRLHLNIEAYIEQERAVQATPLDQPLPRHVRVATLEPARLPRPLEGFGIRPED